MQQFSCFQNCRNKYLTTLSICLVIYVAVVVTLHIQLSRLILDANGFLSISDSNVIDPVQNRLNSGHSRLADSFRQLFPKHRSNVSFPVVDGCQAHRSSASSGGVRFQPLGVDFVYTGYVDDRLQPTGPTYIRVMAVLRRRIAGQQHPRFYARLVGPVTNNSTGGVPYHSLAERADLYEMCENHGLRYGGWIVSWLVPTSLISSSGQVNACRVEVTVQLRSNSSSSKMTVSIPLFRMRSRREQPRSASVDDDPDDVDRRRRNNSSGDEVNGAETAFEDDRLDFAVCIPPMFGDMTAATVVQFIELSRLLGANHFVFYIVDKQTAMSSSSTSSRLPVSNAVRTVLDRYADLGVATTVTWPLPVEAVDSIWYSGQLIAINDCLYRTSHAFRHVLFNDLDEFVVPRLSIHSVPVSWTHMVKELRRLRNRKAAVDDELVLSASSVAEFWFRLLRRIRKTWSSRSRENRDQTSGWSSTKKKSSVLSGGSPCGYSFQSAFFQPVSRTLSPFCRPASDCIPSYDLLMSDRRSPFSLVRTKVMVRPEAVFEVGIHHVSRPLRTLPAVNGTASSSSMTVKMSPTPLIAGHVSARRRPPSAEVMSRLKDHDDDGGSIEAEVISVPPDIGLIHHYRQCVNNYDASMDCSDEAMVKDSGLERSGHVPALQARVRVVLDEFLPTLRN